MPDCLLWLELAIRRKNLTVFIYILYITKKAFVQIMHILKIFHVIRTATKKSNPRKNSLKYFGSENFLDNVQGFYTVLLLKYWKIIRLKFAYLNSNFSYINLSQVTCVCVSQVGVKLVKNWEKVKIILPPTLISTLHSVLFGSDKKRAIQPKFTFSTVIYLDSTYRKHL